MQGVLPCLNVGQFPVPFRFFQNEGRKHFLHHANQISRAQALSVTAHCRQRQIQSPGGFGQIEI